MLNKPNREQLSKVPRLYETENIKTADKIIYLHFYTITNCHWYICEYDGDDLFFGYCILNGWLDCAEFGYVNYSELKECSVGIVQVIFDAEWTPKKFSELNIG